MTNKKHSGFTLVEVIVTLIVASVLAGIIVSIYIVQAREVATSSAYAALNRGYDNYLEQLGQDTRHAKSLSVNNDNSSFLIKKPEIVKKENGELDFDDNGNVKVQDVFIQYSIVEITDPDNRGVIYRDKATSEDALPENAVEKFSVGAGESLTVVLDGSRFSEGNGSVLISEISLIGNDGKEEITLPKRTETFKCKNIK